jgi:phage tail protein X
MSTYRTKQGDVLDAICRAELGSEALVAAVLALNPGLADRGSVYPSGVEIALPDTTPAPVRSGDIRLWGRA